MNKMWASILITLVAIAFIGQLLLMSFSAPIGSPRVVTLQGPIADARNPATFNQPIPLSTDEKEGLTFSQAGWLLVEDWMFRQGSLRCIFNKGSADFSQQCPGVQLDPTSNTLLVKVDTQGDTETIQIPNLPARKWIHFAIVADQNAVNVHIDGVLRTHHSLRQLPRQNKGSVQIAPEGGWAGQIGSLTQQRQALSDPEVTSLVATPPQEDSSRSRVPLPPQFDSSWQLGRY